MQIQFDLEWLILVPIIGQATECLAANSAAAAVRAATIAAQASSIIPRRFVPLMLRNRVGQFIYFIPDAIGRAVRLAVFFTKELTLKVRGSGQ